MLLQTIGPAALEKIAAECLAQRNDVIAAARLVLDRMVFFDEGGCIELSEQSNT